MPIKSCWLCALCYISDEIQMNAHFSRMFLSSIILTVRARWRSSVNRIPVGVRIAGAWVFLLFFDVIAPLEGAGSLK